MKKMVLCMMLLGVSISLFGQQAEVKKYKLMEFRNANINSMLNYISDTTGLTIITHPDLKGNVTIINKEDLTQEQIIDILYSTLRDLGFTIERQDNILSIVPLTQERIKTEIRTDEDIGSLPDGAQIITYIITLKYVTADSVINNIRPFMSKFGNVSINVKMNKLILTDTLSSIKKVFRIVKELDKQESLQGKETEIIYLKNISIDKMESIVLEGFYDLKIIDTANPAMQKISPRSDVQKEPKLKLIKLTEANAFIAIGSKVEIESLKSFISKVDIEVTMSSNQFKLVIIPLNFLNPKKMIDLINQIFTIQNSTTTPSSGGSTWRKTTQPSPQKTSPLSPDSRVLEFPERNSLIFIGPDDDYKRIKDVVDVFEKEIKDTGYKAGEMITKVFHLQNQKAEDLAQIFKSLYPSMGSDKPTLFYAEKNINCIIVNAPSEKINEIGNLMKELDKKLSQVLIKVLIVEVTLNNQMDTGIDWNAVVRLPNLAENINIIKNNSIAPPAGTVNPGLTIQTGGLNAILHTLQTLGDLNVLSTPIILTLDNKEAVINIGKKVAFITETIAITGANQDNSSSSKKVEYRDVGLKLTVKPQINDEKTVTMEIAQTVNDIEASSSGNAEFPNIITREITSTIMAGDAQTAVLGGLISTKNNISTAQVPFFGSIPLLGYFFKHKVTTKEKTELILFITPYVILTAEDLNNVKEETLKKGSAFTKDQLKEIVNKEETKETKETNRIKGKKK